MNYRWVTDITYIITPQKTYYLSAMMDLCGRYIERIDLKAALPRMKSGVKPRNLSLFYDPVCFFRLLLV